MNFINRKSTLLLFSALALAGFSAGCSSSDTAMGTAQLTVSATNAQQVASLTPLQRMWQLIGPTTAQAVTGLMDFAGRPVTLTDFQVAFREVKLKNEGDDDASGMDDDSVDFPGPFAVDLLNDVGTPVNQTVGNAAVPAGSYDGIRFVMRSDPAAAAPLDGKSIYIAGTVEFTLGSPLDFEMWHDTGENFDFFGPNPIVVDGNGINDLIVDFKLLSIFDKINFVDATDLMDINPGALVNADKVLADALKDAIKAAADFGEDSDDDDLLDSDEDVR